MLGEVEKKRHCVGREILPISKQKEGGTDWHVPLTSPERKENQDWRE